MKGGFFHRSVKEASFDDDDGDDDDEDTGSVVDSGPVLLWAFDGF